MANTRTVTIAIPFYNAEKFLAQAIDSVLWQTYTDWKLILLDDGSTDNSLAIAKTYAQSDSRITVISDGQNKNLGYRLNQIPTLVDTEYLARMDADDIMHPKRIEKQINILINHPEINVLGTNAYTINEKDEVVGKRYEDNQSKEIINVEGFIHPTIMARTEWFAKNPYDVEAVRIEDVELWYRTHKTSRFMMLTEPLLFYREIGTDYYKKYFKSNDAKKYILRKYANAKYWNVFFKTNKFKGLIYYLFNLVGMEKLLIQKRNKIIYKKRCNFKTYFNNEG